MVQGEHVRRVRAAERGIPLPLACAGVGFILASLLPGGLTGFLGFVAGLATGFVVIGVRVTLDVSRSRRELASAPHARQATSPEPDSRDIHYVVADEPRSQSRVE